MIERIEAGRRVKAAREATGLTQDAAAALLGITRQQLSRVENGHRVPSWVNLVEMVTTLGLNPKIIVPEFFGRN